MLSPNITTTPRSSRVYICKCGAGTEVGGSDFHRVSSPFSIVSATICTGCGVVPLNAVSWSDTGESVYDFRRRLSSYVPAWLRFLPWLCLMGCVVIGVLMGLAMATGVPGEHLATAFLAILGAVVGFGTGYIVRMVISRKYVGADWADID